MIYEITSKCFKPKGLVSILLNLGKLFLMVEGLLLIFNLLDFDYKFDFFSGSNLSLLLIFIAGFLVHLAEVMRFPDSKNKWCGFECVEAFVSDREAEEKLYELGYEFRELVRLESGGEAKVFFSNETFLVGRRKEYHCFAIVKEDSSRSFYSYHTLKIHRHFGQTRIQKRNYMSLRNLFVFKQRKNKDSNYSCYF